jgi:hypothetical protein
MRLYTESFGLTEARFYASAFMAWLGVVFAWAAASLLRGRAAPFAVGALVSAWLWVLALHAVNPEARIVGVNAARAVAGRPFDVAYVTALSADATPALVARVLPVVAARGTTAERCALAEALQVQRRHDAERRDWRGWSWARFRARRALAAGGAWPAGDAACAERRAAATRD